MSADYVEYFQQFTSVVHLASFGSSPWPSQSLEAVAQALGRQALIKTFLARKPYSAMRLCAYCIVPCSQSTELELCPCLCRATLRAGLLSGFSSIRWLRALV